MDCTIIRAVFNWVSKVIRVLLWFCFTSLCDWLKPFAPLSRPIRSKTQTNQSRLVRAFPRLAPVTCICFEFWLVHWLICVCCDWLGWLLWFWFYDTHLKSALTVKFTISNRNWRVSRLITRNYRFSRLITTNVRMSRLLIVVFLTTEIKKHSFKEEMYILLYPQIAN